MRLVDRLNYKSFLAARCRCLVWKAKTEQAQYRLYQASAALDEAPCYSWSYDGDTQNYYEIDSWHRVSKRVRELGLTN